MCSVTFFDKTNKNLGGRRTVVYIKKRRPRTHAMNPVNAISFFSVSFNRIFAFHPALTSDRILIISHLFLVVTKEENRTSLVAGGHGIRSPVTVIVVRLPCINASPLFTMKLSSYSGPLAAVATTWLVSLCHAEPLPSSSTSHHAAVDRHSHLSRRSLATILTQVPACAVSINEKAFPAAGLLQRRH